MPQGQVKWFDSRKGYGFIIGPDSRDVFVHYTHIVREGFKTLRNGEHVTYEIYESDKGLRATKVVPEEREDEVSTPDEVVSGGYVGAGR